MDVLCLILFLIILLIKEIDNVLMKRTVLKGIQLDNLLYDEEEVSLLQCAQRCKYIDKDSLIDFKGSRCRCIRYHKNVKSDETLSGIFMNQKIVKIHEEEPIVYKLENVALNKPATMSTTHSTPYSADKANDGDLNTRCSTLRQVKAWWRVDLKGVFDIKYMLITGYSSHNNRDLHILTSQGHHHRFETCVEVSGFLGETERKITCSKPTSARYVLVRSESSISKFVTIKEFELYAPVHE